MYSSRSKVVRMRMRAARSAATMRRGGLEVVETGHAGSHGDAREPRASSVGGLRLARRAAARRAAHRRGLPGSRPVHHPDRRPRLAVRARGRPRRARAGHAAVVRRPRDPLVALPACSGRRGGRLWLVAVPFILLFGLEELVPGPGCPPPATWSSSSSPRPARRSSTAALVDTFAVSWPSKRYRSALIGSVVHSLQSVVLLGLVLSLVLEG